MSETLLSIKNLKTYFVTDEAVLKAVDDVSFDVKEGETLGVVGESGCGKSVSCMSIVRLVQGNVSYAGGEILFEGKNTLEMSEKELRKIRGKDISIIFQEPMTALNPLYTIGDQMMEALKNHQKISTGQARKKSAEGENPHTGGNDVPLSLQPFRRNAPESDDRHGAHYRAEADHCG